MNRRCISARWARWCPSALIAIAVLLGATRVLAHDAAPAAADAAMPQVIEATQTATASLPRPRRIEDHTPAERALLAQRLGVEETMLQDPKTQP